MNDFPAYTLVDTETRRITSHFVQQAFQISVALPNEAAVSKQHLFNKTSSEKALVFAHHFPPFPNLGYISKRGIGWEWQPVQAAISA